MILSQLFILMELMLTQRNPATSRLSSFLTVCIKVGIYKSVSWSLPLMAIYWTIRGRTFLIIITTTQHCSGTSLTMVTPNPTLKIRHKDWTFSQSRRITDTQRPSSQPKYSVTKTQKTTVAAPGLKAPSKGTRKPPIEPTDPHKSRTQLVHCPDLPGHDSSISTDALRCGKITVSVRNNFYP